MTEQNYFVDTPWTWRDRLRFKLFPSRPCPLPEAPAVYQDVLVTRCVTEFSLMDRLRILLVGRVMVETRTVTENIVGGAISKSVSYPLPPGEVR